MSFLREVDAVLRFLKQQCGAKHIGAVGFCWGGVATHYLALQYHPEIKAGVSVYGMPRPCLSLPKSMITVLQNSNPCSQNMLL